MKTDSETQIIHEKLSPVYERRLTHLKNLMVVECTFRNGPMKDPDPPHSHPHEQITYVAEGELLFFKEMNKYHLKKGDMITVPAGVPHTIQNISALVRLIDSFCPIRNDFLKTKEDKT